MLKKFEAFIQGMAIGAAVLAFIVVLVVTLEVLGRNLLNRTIPGVDELSEYALYIMCLLPTPWLVHQGQHIRIDIVVNSLPKRLGNIIELALDCVAGLVCLVFTFVSLQVIHNSYAQGSKVFKTYIFPEWWVYAPLPLIFTLLAICFAIRVRTRFKTGAAPMAGSASL
jgi:TRAP-type C4-dicarboxylate transport system permease small subunit